VRSPPLRGEAKPSWDGLAGKTRRRCERRFSRRGVVSAPGLQAGRKPGHNMIIRGKGTAGDLAGICHSSTRRLPLRACRARPSAKPEPGQGEPAGSKARCIGKARCRHCGRAEPAPWITLSEGPLRDMGVRGVRVLLQKEIARSLWRAYPGKGAEKE